MRTPDMAAPPAPEAPSTGTRAWLWARLRGERKRAEDHLKRAQWVQAELENVRKQAARDGQQAAEKAVRDVLLRLLPVLDSLEAAPASEGLTMVRAELERALAAEGLHPIEAAGQAFDPLRHEAIQRTERPCAPGEAPGLVVEQELRRGWAHRGRVLRPAMVRVVERTPSEPGGAPPPPRVPSPSQGA